jgi:hypothetical protein
MYSQWKFGTMIPLGVLNGLKGGPETRISFPVLEAPDLISGMPLFYEDVSIPGGAGGGIQ